LLAIKYLTCNRIQWLKLFNFCFDVIIPFDLEVEFSLGWKRLGFDFEVNAEELELLYQWCSDKVMLLFLLWI
ncbi:unnamed protein product, partial [Brassica napus]